MGKYKKKIGSKVLIIAFIVCLVSCVINIESFAAIENSPYQIKPWQVGQYAVYKIISMEGEDADNRYVVSIIGKEEISGKDYFWIKIDIWGNTTIYGYNKIFRELKKNLSLKALVLPKSTNLFEDDPASFITLGIFPTDSLSLQIQIDNRQWYTVDPKQFFNHEGILDDTPYAISPYAKGRINFSKLKVDEVASMIEIPLGKILCYHFFVNTHVNEEYWDEGFDLWRSSEVPILGLVKMEFSKTLYWEKWEYKNNASAQKTFLNFIKTLYKKRVTGRRRSDICSIILLDYGPKY